MDPLEGRLREALRDDAWRLPADSDLLARVRVNAAARRRRHRTAAVTAVAVFLLVAGMGGVGYIFRQPVLTVAGKSASTTVERARGTAPDPTQDDTAGVPAPTRRPSSTRAPSPTAASRTPSPTPPGKSATPDVAVGVVPAKFSPVSLTAASDQNFWVLGESAAGPGRATVVVTRDGGERFTALPEFAAPVVRATNKVTADTVHDVRFAADTKDGWAYGGALWSTHDGGQGWQQVRTVPGLVQQLETANGTAYALVRDGSTWTLWRSPRGEDTWSRAGVELHSPASLAVTSQVVAVTDRSGNDAYVLTSADGGDTFDQHPTPCKADLDAGRLSATTDSMWLTCPTGTAAEVHVSRDEGASWTAVSSGTPAISGTAAALGARSGRQAVVAVPGKALVVSESGQPAQAKVEGLGTPTYAGFTSDRVGYILDVDGGLFRTADGGGTWQPVTVR
ncbi:hypothetical protein SAMN05421678_105220 [Actinopolymorpha cephalotaxi]|uniref:Photosystem II stability/assembly factor-like uncharacterized protein n=1 Tax=Actinopolymorpha cephalotaxi TaxID=504797 RepID=A0A1I2R3M0_9ACTN|nr:hypothetical protein [Actinopolymorpha cephalotaxi]NYH82374.1 photosystem II stability/assembly factor-like uncharacterized protein [Actinopolymorpha cephalotaxi]SFG35000.1 hypothetical protein SAMN05421678_105220 [Actinopolymorpha cephalotaxi]